MGFNMGNLMDTKGGLLGIFSFSIKIEGHTTFKKKERRDMDTTRMSRSLAEDLHQAPLCKI